MLKSLMISESGNILLVKILENLKRAELAKDQKIQSPCLLAESEASKMPKFKYLASRILHICYFADVVKIFGEIQIKKLKRVFLMPEPTQNNSDTQINSKNRISETVYLKRSICVAQFWTIKISFHICYSKKIFLL